MPVTAVFRFHKDYGVIAILPEYIYPLTRRPGEYVITMYIHMESDYFKGCLYEEMMKVTVAAPKELYVDLLNEMQVQWGGTVIEPRRRRIYENRGRQTVCPIRNSKWRNSLQDYEYQSRLQPMTWEHMRTRLEPHFLGGIAPMPREQLPGWVKAE